MKEEKTYSTVAVSQILGVSYETARNCADILKLEKTESGYKYLWKEKDIDEAKKIIRQNKNGRTTNRLYKTKDFNSVSLDTLYHRAIRYRKRGDNEKYKETLELIKQKKGEKKC